ncbi:PEP-CTERM sorting domain-containing protein [Pelagibius sp. Alg239-R121]|uniref:PEP-CTERM sorting domain-containing protein n=1 Tax=Pelagibius sp. Alg239-R121 TaxID=2993448 RepID=UPI0024A6C9CA|nr:PEP-CTERM sorting domain-containing protein [Pelagibius sp. Alg239-R121]
MISFEQILYATRMVAPRLLGMLMLAAAITPNSAKAGLVQVDLSFTASGFVADFPNVTPPTDPVSGSFSFQFDDSGIPAIGFGQVDDISLSAISLSFAGFDFPLNDVNARVNYFDGDAFSLSVFGLFLGSSVSSLSDRHDFSFITNIPFGPNSIRYAIPGTNATYGDATVVINEFRFEELPVSVAVPEPATFALLSLGLVGLGAMKRRSKVASQS